VKIGGFGSLVVAYGGEGDEGEEPERRESIGGVTRRRRKKRGGRHGFIKMPSILPLFLFLFQVV